MVHLYNRKFGRPATDLYQLARSSQLITSDTTFDDEIEFTYFFLWHHEGRRARMGAAMMAPDYTQWHGFYEVAHRFYMEFVPQLREIIEHGKKKGGRRSAAAHRLEAELERVLQSEEHRWFLGRMSPGERAARKRAAEEFRKRYSQES